MNFETLDLDQTKIWISNIEKTIALADALTERFDRRMKDLDEQYSSIYLSGWRKLFYDSEYFISAGGNIYSTGLWKAWKMTPLSEAENKLRYFVDFYRTEKQTEYKETHERWAKYAKQPFEIHESDIIFYQKMKRFHAKATEIADNLGMKYEAFNLDEDS